MKALLLKDFYMAKRYCRAYLLIIVVFLLTAVFSHGQNLFFLGYPCVLAGMVPTTLLSFDERMGWTSYCGCLPYTKAQLVGEKYLLGLIAQVLVWLLTMGCMALNMTRGGFDGRTFAVTGLILIAVAMLPGAINLPAILLLGTERGRIVTLGVVALLCGGGAVMNLQSREDAAAVTLSGIPVSAAALTAAVSALLYALSFFLALRCYPGKLKD